MSPKTDINRGSVPKDDQGNGLWRIEYHMSDDVA